MQPLSHDPLRGGYMINFVRPRPVTVLADRQGVAELADVDAFLYDMDLFAEDNIRLPLDLDLEFADGAGI